MYDFPIPYKDELLYSTIARYGIRLGLLSPKSLLDEVFGFRNVVATIDLPSHVGLISKHYNEGQRLSALKLIYSHTLFPIYAPFITEPDRQRCLSLMTNTSKGKVHLISGIAASRVKQPAYLRYCPYCLSDQIDSFGETFWDRKWQITGSDHCLIHGTLLNSSIARHSRHKHQFYPCVFPTNTPPIKNNIGASTKGLIKSIYQLLELKPNTSPNKNQWTEFYKQVKHESGFSKGEYTDYAPLREAVLNRFGTDWLKQHQVYPTLNESCWLKAIFRKHRKAFSYLEHLIVWHSLMPYDWDIADILERVRNLPKNVSKISGKQLPTTGSEKDKYRAKWLQATKTKTTTEARSSGYAPVYTWLYRHDKSWLLDVNNLNKAKKKTVNNRVNWKVRDITLVKKLLRIKDNAEFELDSPRRSHTWYISKLSCTATLEKYLHRLPLCKLFLMRYGESVEEYQIRRISQFVIAQHLSGESLSRWKVLRGSGLSERRLTKLARNFLSEVVEDLWINLE